MLQPKRVKYRRPHIIRYEGLSKGGNTVAFGEYGLQATSGNWVSDRQIEACRIVLSRYTKREGKIYISARSIDEVNVQVIMERMGGGGHMNVAACQLESTGIAEAIGALKKTLDDMLDNNEI